MDLFEILYLVPGGGIVNAIMTVTARMQVFDLTESTCNFIIVLVDVCVCVCVCVFCVCVCVCYISAMHTNMGDRM